MEDELTMEVLETLLNGFQGFAIAMSAKDRKTVLIGSDREVEAFQPIEKLLGMIFGDMRIVISFK